jgi:arsenite methyltransferase
VENQTSIEPDILRSAVRKHYATLVSPHVEGLPSSGCCTPTGQSMADQAARGMGYSEESLSIIQDANLGVSCGNPVGLASLERGHQVLDLGSGAGMDVFLAANQVGPTGRVIGVDMTPEMIQRARASARTRGINWAEFRLGEIECLPVETSTIDVILSNCVINLSPEKERVLKEAYRVLKPGGRLAISDVVLTAPLPPEAQGDLELYSCCALGAWPIANWEQTLTRLGFKNITVRPKQESRELVRTWSPNIPLDQYILSADIAAKKPA